MKKIILFFLVTIGFFVFRFLYIKVEDFKNGSWLAKSGQNKKSL
jgi:hypothetical protein